MVRIAHSHKVRPAALVGVRKLTTRGGEGCTIVGRKRGDTAVRPERTTRCTGERRCEARVRMGPSEQYRRELGRVVQRGVTTPPHRRSTVAERRASVALVPENAVLVGGLWESKDWTLTATVWYENPRPAGRGQGGSLPRWR